MNRSVLARRLCRYVALTVDDVRLLDDALRERIRLIGPRGDVSREGETSRCLFAILEGWAVRTKSLEDGRRQIVSFALPGDVCEQSALLLSKTDHGLCAVTPVTVAEITPALLTDLSNASVRLSLALTWSDLVSSAVQREWTVNLGQRSAIERMAHLICELFFRLRAIGMTHDLTCELPVTQAMLADATGISAVHVNRTLQELRASNLITLRGKHLTIHDLEALQATAHFNEAYLHLDDAARFDADSPGAALARPLAFARISGA